MVVNTLHIYNGGLLIWRMNSVYLRYLCMADLIKVIIVSSVFLWLRQNLQSVSMDLFLTIILVTLTFDHSNLQNSNAR